MRLLLYVLLLLTYSAKSQDVKHYGAPLSTAANILLEPNADGQYILATNVYSEELFFLEGGYAHYRQQCGLHLLDATGEVLLEHQFKTGYSETPDTNYYIEDLIRSHGHIWVLLRMDYFENDTMRWEKSKVLKYSEDLIELQETVDLTDSLYFGARNFHVDSNVITVIGTSSADRWRNTEPTYITSKQYFLEADSLISTSVPNTEFSSILPFNSLHYNPDRKEFYWVPNSLFPEVLTFSQSNGFQSYQLFSGTLNNIVSYALEDRFIVAGNYRETGQPEEAIAFAEFNFDYQLGHSRIFDIELDNKSTRVTSLDLLPNGDLSAALADFPEQGSDEKASGRIVHLGPPGSLDVVKEISYELPDDLFARQHVTLPNDRYAFLGSTRIPSDSAVAVLILSDDKGISSINRYTHKASSAILLTNPVSQKLYLQEIDHFPISLTISSLTGQQLHKKDISKQQPIDVGQLSAGTYILHVVDHLGQHYTQRFIKQ